MVLKPGSCPQDRNLHFQFLSTRVWEELNFFLAKYNFKRRSAQKSRDPTSIRYHQNKEMEVAWSHSKKRKLWNHKASPQMEPTRKKKTWQTEENLEASAPDRVDKGGPDHELCWDQSKGQKRVEESCPWPMPSSIGRTKADDDDDTCVPFCSFL